jgi:hypothetical protein
VGVDLLAEIARASVATTFLAAIGCVLAAGFAIPMSASPFQPAEAAFRLARLMALLGGAAAFLCGTTATLWAWLIGATSERAFVLIEMVLLGAAVVFAVAVAALLSAQRTSRPS